MKIVKGLFFVCFFIAALITFLPKKSLYYYAEERLGEFKGVIANEQVDEGVFSLHLEHADLYFEGIHAAKVLDAEFRLYLLGNIFEAHKIRLSGMAKSFLPTKIETLKVRYDLWSPLKVVFWANGEFGEARGEYMITSHTLLVYLHPSKTMQNSYHNLLRRMKKEKSGEYRYEQRF